MAVNPFALMAEEAGIPPATVDPTKVAATRRAKAKRVVQEPHWACALEYGDLYDDHVLWAKVKGGAKLVKLPDPSSIVTLATNFKEYTLFEAEPHSHYWDDIKLAMDALSSWTKAVTRRLDEVVPKVSGPFGTYRPILLVTDEYCPIRANTLFTARLILKEL